MVLVILQWNARSLIANGQEFKRYIFEQQNKPHIICVQETWLKPQLDFIIQGYTTVRNDREGGKGGGVATFIQSGINYSVSSVGKEQESICIKTWTGNNSVTIINYYNPCNKLTPGILNDIGGQSRGKIVCGDFNAHSTLWGSKSTDVNGLVVEEFIEDNGLVCINSGKGTRYNSANNTESVIDLTLVKVGGK